MKTGNAILLGIAGIVAAGFLWYLSTYNGLTSSDENVNRIHGQVQNVLDRQEQLIPNLVATVKGYSAHEADTLKEVASARSGLSGIEKLDPTKVDPAMRDQIIQAQREAAGKATLAKVTALREAYPDLKANQQFNNLSSELAGSVNRVSVERKREQDAIRDYNYRVRSFMGRFVANQMGLQPRPYFEASATAQNAPKVSF